MCLSGGSVRKPSCWLGERLAWQAPVRVWPHPPLPVPTTPLPCEHPLCGCRTNNIVAHAKGLLQVMREETEKMKRDPALAKPSEVRVRENLQNTLTRKFVDIAKDYQNKQVRTVLPFGRGPGRAIPPLSPPPPSGLIPSSIVHRDKAFLAMGMLTIRPRVFVTGVCTSCALCRCEVSFAAGFCGSRSYE